MGYIIQIGEAATMEEDGETRTCVQDATRPDSPALLPGEVQTGQANYRIMSGTNLGCFAHETGLTALFYEDGIRRDGAYPVTDETLAVIQGAIEHLLAAHPDAVDGPFNKVETWHYDLHRLVWFRWWFAWALANCERPVMYIG